ncbi:hypothetical protein [Arthrobacter sp. V4I6]|uniref:hypothetical protein n=1 Tax=Arthrobacter sp. V4I6 TaxID=3042281 RepID=UPI0027D81340|nr:hypothetical protein [Arthrobacter sp. V4I6]
MALPLERFPGPDVLGREGNKSYEREISEWQQLATGRRFRLGIQFDDALRRFARVMAPDPAMGRLLVRSRREFSRTVHTLTAAGVHPRELSVSDDLGRAAVDAWAWLENEIPSLAAPRTDLWIDFQEFKTQSTSHARNLRDRIDRALEAAFGIARGTRAIVHHGFYFFTPPQWALFQLLRCIPNVDQIFVVHDDGANPAFETWRRFFVDKWDMPVPGPVTTPQGGSSGAADIAPGGEALLKALSGEPVALDGLAESVTVLECRSPAELVRQWRRETVAGRGNPPRWFGADAKSVERFVRRLAGDAGSGPTDLAQLPIGTFLLAIHDCIKPLAGGGAEVVLSDETLLDIAASGYLETHGLRGQTVDYVSALRRGLPFFRGCTTGEQWRERAIQLNRLIIAEVEPLGERDHESSDVERIRLAAGNPLRLIPWGDLSRDEAAGITAVISSTVALVEEMASRERVALKDHIRFLRSKLAQGMRDLAEDERREIAAKVEGFSVGLDDEIDVDGLVDVVGMLLGRTAEFDALGDLEPSAGAISELRGLDALGLRKQEGDVHLTNMAEGAFPSFVQTMSWPFRMDDMVGATASVDSITVEILSARAENAALSDLYLLWLALDGVTTGNKVTLSWISEIGGERHNPSAILSLLTRPIRATDAIRTRAAGLRVGVVSPAGDVGGLAEPTPLAAQSVPATELSRAVDRVDARAAASAVVCARRLALQWILGQSAAYQSEHHHSMLYGNIVGALARLKHLSAMKASRTANDLWRHFTPGQRSSSLAKRVINVTGRSAHGLWILTLAGKSRPSDNPLDLAYQTAVRGERPALDIIVPAPSEYLPPGVDDPDVCDQCPVRLSCAVWAQQPD